MDISPPSPDNRIAQAVLAAMAAKGETELGLSEAAWIPRTTLRRRLSGRTSFTIKELGRIAAHLGVDVVTLISAADAA